MLFLLFNQIKDNEKNKLMAKLTNLRECLLQEITFLLGAHSGEDFASHMQGNGNASLTDTTATSMNQHALTGPQSTTDAQSVVARGVDDGYSGGFLEGPFVGHLPHEARVGKDSSGETTRGYHTHNAAALGVTTGELETEDAVLAGQVARESVSIQLARCQHDVTIKKGEIVRTEEIEVEVGA